MYKPYLTFLLLLVAVTSAAQINKIYMTADRSKTQDLRKAKFYVLYEKLTDDSAWYARTYNMVGTLVATGTYKDEALTIQHGKFTFYKVQMPDKSLLYRYNVILHRIDSIKPKNFAFQKGYYINGVKTGKWLEYNVNNELIKSATYVNDKLDGPYKEYYWGNVDNVYMDGNYVDNRKEGNWYVYNHEKDTIATMYYSRGSFGKVFPYESKHKYIEAKPPYSVIRYLNFEMAKMKFSKVGSSEALYKFRLTKEGKLTEPDIFIASIKDIDEVIIGKFLDGPDWVPASRDGKICEKEISLNFKIRIDENGNAAISYLTDKGCISY